MKNQLSKTTAPKNISTILDCALTFFVLTFDDDTHILRCSCDGFHRRFQVRRIHIGHLLLRDLLDVTHLDCRDLVLLLERGAAGTGGKAQAECIVGRLFDAGAVCAVLVDR